MIAVEDDFGGELELDWIVAFFRFLPWFAPWFLRIDYERGPWMFLRRPA